MSLVFETVFPVFSLIALGYLAGRFKWVGDETATGLAQFTFNLAIPALLFRTMATAELPDVAPIAVWSAYFGTVLTAWAIATVLVPSVLRRPLADSAPIAMSSGFGNVVMLGIPLSISTLGTEAAGPIALIISVHTPTLWTLATLHMLFTNRDAGAHGIGETIKSVADELIHNPLIVAIVLGTLWRFTGLGLHPVIDKSMSFLAQAAIPGALVALGLSLIRFRIAGQVPTLTMILSLKLILMPLIAWILAYEVLALPPIAAGVVMFFAAAPTGANAFLFATKYGRAMNSASGAVALGTALSFVTASILVLILQRATP